MDAYNSNRFEAYLDQNRHTLLIRRRFDVPAFGYCVAPPAGHYACLPPGQERAESLSLALPVYPRITFGLPLPVEGTVLANRLALEIGYHPENLPELVRGILEIVEKLDCTVADPLRKISGTKIRHFFGAFGVSTYSGELSGFERQNQHLDMSKEVLIPWTSNALTGERTARLVIESVSIPYTDRSSWGQMQSTDNPGSNP